ncbi:unnamed protein product [Oikopleura dioica]|uniref:Mothers against decapentaplegic homolog n=1 Tax=Oikopleura dioica TaxID=34765 RepID=E4Y741_OIKDI|nr:unnamed protein product [Oikopleura dioica]
MNLKHTLTKKTKDTPCIRIPRSLDGRLQVQHRKTLPHLLYVQIFRFPEVRTAPELTSISNCKYAFMLRLEEVCVNPFHYEKVQEVNTLPPVLVPTYPAEYSSHLMPSPMHTPHLQDSLSQSFTNNLNMQNTVHQEQQLPGPSTNHGIFTNVSYEESYNWCTVSYYETGNRLGKQFEITVPFLTIDGFTNPSEEDRICLGNISNPNRDSTIKMTRTNIGRGIQISYQLGEVTIRNVSEASIFVQSQNMNRFFGADPKTVVKINAGQSAAIFNNQSFAGILSDSVNHGFEAVYDLTKMCSIRISFVKGWGSEYRRQHVTSVPCWIEMHLNGPLQWLDGVLQQMGSATKKSSILYHETVIKTQITMGVKTWHKIRVFLRTRYSNIIDKINEMAGIIIEFPSSFFVPEIKKQQSENKEYTFKIIEQYEQIFGRGFLSTGGMVTTQALLQRINPKRGQTVLSVGCGVGGAEIFMAQNYGVRVHAIDISQNAINIACDRAAECNISEKLVFEQADVLSREFGEEQFDVIYSKDCLKHIRQKSELFVKFQRWLKPGGQLVIADYICCEENEKTKDFRRYAAENDYDIQPFEQYAYQLESTGFNVRASNLAPWYANNLNMEISQLESTKIEFIKTFSKKEFKRLINRWSNKLSRCENGIQQWAFFECTK